MNLKFDLIKINSIKFIILHPASLFAFVWIFVLYLYTLRCSEILYPINSTTIILITSGILSGLLASAVAHLLIKPTVRLKYKNNLLNNNFRRLLIEKFIVFLENKCKFLFILWLAVSIIEIIYSGGVPFLWLFDNSGKTYRDFGIANFSIHGFNNSIYLTICISAFFVYRLTQNKKYLFYYIGLLLWSIVLMKRILLYSIGLESLFIYIVTTRGKFLSFFFIAKIFSGLIFSVWMFGYLGDLRYGFSDLIYLIARPTESWPKFLPATYLWIYIYITSPLNNIVANIDTINPTYTPSLIVERILPSAIAQLVFPDGKNTSNFELVVSSLNVSTFYQVFIIDFGIIGAIIIVFIILLLSSIIFEKTTVFGDRKPWLYLTYSVIFQGLLLSVFDNVLIHPVFLFQTFIFGGLGKIFKNKYSSLYKENFHLFGKITSLVKTQK